ncbi:MAG: GNAT family N-acetyltransferase [Deltaproteobacteria bacterium]|nr:GNAT family N-acetyltransferase [Deltaproteobacteria bacterium]
MIAIEPIATANVAPYKSIRLRALQDTPTAFSATYSEEAKFTDADWLMRASQLSSTKSTGYLALDSGVAVGIAAGFLDRNDPSRAELVSMWVAPTHRRQGIGRLLVEAVSDWARAQNIPSLLLLVTSNNHAAIAFYQRLGFSLTGKTEPYRNDPALSNFEMIRPN